MASLAWLESLGVSGVGGTVITSDASAHTKGAAVSLGTSSGAAAAVEIRLNSPTQARSFLVDFGADEAGGTTYTYFAQNIPIVCANSATASAVQTFSLVLPMAFASGTQFACRCQDDTGSATLGASIILYSGTTPYTVSFVESSGDTSTSRATSVDPGASAGTKGAWTQMIASTSGAADWIAPIVMGQASQTVFNGGRLALDVATGASSSEVVKLGDAFFNESNDECRHGSSRPYEVDIASGARVAARLASASSTAGRREADVGVLLFVKSAVGGGGGRATRIIGG